MAFCFSFGFLFRLESWKVGRRGTRRAAHTPLRLKQGQVEQWEPGGATAEGSERGEQRSFFNDFPFILISFLPATTDKNQDRAKDAKSPLPFVNGKTAARHATTKHKKKGKSKRSHTKERKANTTRKPRMATVWTLRRRRRGLHGCQTRFFLGLAGQTRRKETKKRRGSGSERGSHKKSHSFLFFFFLLTIDDELFMTQVFPPPNLFHFFTPAG